MNSKGKCNCTILYKMFIPHFLLPFLHVFFPTCHLKRQYWVQMFLPWLLWYQPLERLFGLQTPQESRYLHPLVCWIGHFLCLKKIILFRQNIEGYLLASFKWLCGVNRQMCIPREYHFALFLLSMKVKGLMTLKKWPVLQEVIKAATLKYSPSAPSSLIPVMIMVRNGFMFIMLRKKPFSSLILLKTFRWHLETF